MALSAVIFDMDGLMVDTEPLYQVSWRQAARELGYGIDDTLYARFVGRPTHVCEEILVDAAGDGFPIEAFRARWPILWREAVEQHGVQLKPGLFELLDYLQERRIPIAVATSSEANYANYTLERAGIRDRFTIVVSGDQIAHGKPAPDIYLEAARRLRVPASDCIALEDSEAGIVAVKRAGMMGILVPHWPASLDAHQAAAHVATTLYGAKEIVASMLDQTESNS